MNIEFSDFLNLLDISFIVIIIISFFFGIKNGFIKSLFNFIKWVIIFYLIKNSFIVLRPFFDIYISNQTLSDAVIFLSTLIVSYIIISFINRIVIGLLQPKRALIVDISFGGLLGLLRGYVIFILIIFFLNNNLSTGTILKMVDKSGFNEILKYGIELIDQIPRNFNQLQDLDI